jgi:anti-sigma-K factor RskA
MSDHDPFRELTASYVLGSLSADERETVEHHLETCDRCRSQTLEFAPLPALLGLVDLQDLDGGPDVEGAEAVVERARQELARLRTSSHRWRTAFTVSAAAVVLLAGAIVLIDRGSPGGNTDQVAMLILSSDRVVGEIVADERAWGTYVHVSVRGLPERPIYRLWAVDESGVWHEASSWLPTPDGSARLGGSTHLRLAEIALLVVTSDDQRDEILTAR